MIFTLKANTKFEAEDIDDAFLKLSYYFFRAITSELPDKSLFIAGEISVYAPDETLSMQVSRKEPGETL